MLFRSERYVQVRVPDQDVAVELLGKTGPLVVSAARPAASEPRRRLSEILATSEKVIVRLTGRGLVNSNRVIELPLASLPKRAPSPAAMLA